MPEGTIRIMLVEDASLARLYYRSILEPAGYAVDQALNGVEAFERLLDVPADLLVVDINMPLMDGLTFVRRLRQRADDLSSIPVLITSTESDPQDYTAARQAGANFYLAKPVAGEVLLDHVGLMTGGPRWTR